MDTGRSESNGSKYSSKNVPNPVPSQASPDARVTSPDGRSDSQSAIDPLSKVRSLPERLQAFRQ